MPALETFARTAIPVLRPSTLVRCCARALPAEPAHICIRGETRFRDPDDFSSTAGSNGHMMSPAEVHFLPQSH